MNKKRSGFTFIEIILVVFIVSLILSIATLYFNQIRRNTRDMQRISNVKQIQLALEMYRRDTGVYPLMLDFGLPLINPSDSSIIYLNEVLSNPRPRTDGGCPDEEYIYESDGISYTIEFCLSNERKDISSGVNCAMLSGIRGGECFICGESSIYYGGQSYKTAQIGNQCWLAENLNAGTMLCSVIGNSCAEEPDNNFDYNNIEKYCYQNNPDNCSAHGALYTWTEAMGIPIKCKEGLYTINAELDYYTHELHYDCNIAIPARGACPPGWHIVSYLYGHSMSDYRNEWKILTDYLSVHGQGGTGIEVGGKMKYTGLTSWSDPNVCGDNVICNSSGFSGKGSGYRFSGGSYSGIREIGQFWTTSHWGSNMVKLFLINSGSYLGASSYAGEKNSAMGVRCIKDN